MQQDTGSSLSTGANVICPIVPGTQTEKGNTGRITRILADQGVAYVTLDHQSALKEHPFFLKDLAPVQYPADDPY
jgi:hypothetical protein